MASESCTGIIAVIRYRSQNQISVRIVEGIRRVSDVILEFVIAPAVGSQLVLKVQ